MTTRSGRAASAADAVAVAVGAVAVGAKAEKGANRGQIVLLAAAAAVGGEAAAVTPKTGVGNALAASGSAVSQ
jgi:hypothetical protein